MFAIDHDMRVNLSGEVQYLVCFLQMQQLQYLCYLQLLLRMETLYFPADAVIARAAHYLKDTERNALANQVENDYTPIYLLLEWQSFWFFTGDDNNGGKSGNESTY